MTDIEVAEMLGIGLATLYRWKLDFPAFSRVFKLGKEEADNRVERSLYSRAVGYAYIAEKPVMTRRPKDHAISAAHPTRHRGRTVVSQKPSAGPMARRSPPRARHEPI
jgi:hypothetical protein